MHKIILGFKNDRFSEFNEDLFRAFDHLRSVDYDNGAVLLEFGRTLTAEELTRFHKILEGYKK